MAVSASVGACGLYCGSCPHYLARTNAGLKTRLTDALNCREEDVVCRGCRDVTNKCWGYHCKIRLCAEKSGRANCDQCPQLPCEKLKRLSAGYWNMPVQQLQELREKGELSFLKLMEERWTCSCGGPISCYTNKCIACEKEVVEMMK